MKRIIVTGGYGFIGSNLIRILLKKNYKVLNIDNLKYSSNKYNLANLKSRNYTFLKTDINDKLKLIKYFEKFKPYAIFNLAAETHVDRSIINPSAFIKSNILGVFNLLEAIKNYKSKTNINIKLIHISTDEVYGDIKKPARSDENYSYKPSSPYSASKASADHLILSYVRTYRLNAIITNCSNNYGPRQFPEKFIPKIIYNIINNKTIPVYGRGKNSREWLYVTDHCNALIKILKKGKLGEKYNIGSNINLTNLEVVKTILDVVRKNKLVYIGKNVKIKFVKDRPGHDLRYAINSKKLKKELNWKSKISFDKGIFQTIKWYVDNKKYFDLIPKKRFVKRIGLFK